MDAVISDAYTRWLSKRTPNVRRRIERLNPGGPDEGCYVRGYHPSGRWDPGLHRDIMRKGQFLKRYGRNAWAQLKRGQIVKIGRREGVTSLAIMQLGLR